jgi:hypothetical protein
MSLTTAIGSAQRTGAWTGGNNPFSTIQELARRSRANVGNAAPPRIALGRAEGRQGL